MHKVLKKFDLSEGQKEQFSLYADMLVSENQKFNITAITDEKDVYKLHFADSLQLSNCYDLTQIKSIADVGCGGGFPGIPLKIMFPHLVLHAIEVNEKKAQFLQEVASALNLENVFVHTYDWRTFLRMHDEKIDLFVARASLQVSELVRIFKPSSIQKDSLLFYWASQNWQPSQKEKAYVKDSYSYFVADRQRFIIRFENTK